MCCNQKDTLSIAPIAYPRGKRHDSCYKNYLNFIKFSNKHEHEINALEQLLACWVPQSANAKIIDIGAGAGRLSRIVCNYFSDKSIPFGMTLLEPSHIASLQLDVDFKNNTHINTVNSSFQKWYSTEKRGKFDFVLASNVNYYFKNRNSFLMNVISLLNGTGTLCCISGSMSLFRHSIFLDLMPKLMSKNTPRSFAVDGYMSCSEELQIIAMNNNFHFTSYDLESYTIIPPAKIRKAISDLHSYKTCVTNEVCKALGFLMRIPVDYMYSSRHHVINYFELSNFSETGISIKSNETALFLRMNS